MAAGKLCMLRSGTHGLSLSLGFVNVLIRAIVYILARCYIVGNVIIPEGGGLVCGTKEEHMDT